MPQIQERQTPPTKDSLSAKKELKFKDEIKVIGPTNSSLTYDETLKISPERQAEGNTSRHSSRCGTDIEMEESTVVDNSNILDPSLSIPFNRSTTSPHASNSFGCDQDDLASVKSDNYPKPRLQRQRPMSSGLSDFRKNSSHVENTKVGRQAAPRRRNRQAHIERLDYRPSTPSASRPVQHRCRVTKKPVKVKSRPAPDAQQVSDIRSVEENIVSDEEFLGSLATRMRHLKAAQIINQEKIEEQEMQVLGLTAAYNDCYEKWQNAEETIKVSEEKLGKYGEVHMRWKEKFSRYEKFMEGFQKDFKAQVIGSKRLTEQIESAQRAEKAVKAELAELMQRTAKDRESSAARLKITKGYAQELERFLKESRASFEETSRLLTEERVKVSRSESQLQMVQTNQSALSDKLVEISNLVRDCSGSISEGRKETMSQLKICRRGLEVLIEDDIVNPAGVQEVKESITLLTKRYVYLLSPFFEPIVDSGRKN
jgi:hypothetical protein